MVIAITITPTPPSHCKMALHIRILFGALSKSVIIVDPVVVIPDMLSKNASTNDKSRFDNRKGMHPKIAMLNHDNVVNKKACCKFSFLFSSKFVSTNKMPMKTVKEADAKNELLSSLYIYCKKNGISINAPNIIRSTPIAKKTVLILFIFDVGGYLKIFKIQHNKTLLYLYFTREI